MRLLLDENLSPRIVDILVAAGIKSVHVRELGMAGATDQDVLAAARRDGLVVVTADRGDFGRELAASAATRPSVVLLRQLPAVVRATDVAALLLANLTPDVTAELDSGAFVVFSRHLVRVRRLPLR